MLNITLQKAAKAVLVCIAFPIKEVYFFSLAVLIHQKGNLLVSCSFLMNSCFLAHLLPWALCSFTVGPTANGLVSVMSQSDQLLINTMCCYQEPVGDNAASTTLQNSAREVGDYSQILGSTDWLQNSTFHKATAGDLKKVTLRQTRSVNLRSNLIFLFVCFEFRFFLLPYI